MAHEERKRYLHKKRTFKKTFSVIFIIVGAIVAVLLLWMLVKIIGGMMPQVGEEAMGLFVN